MLRGAPGGTTAPARHYGPLPTHPSTVQTTNAYAIAGISRSLAESSSLRFLPALHLSTAAVRIQLVLSASAFLGFA